MDNTISLSQHDSTILKSFLILSGVDLGNDLLQLSLCFALGKVAHVVILWRHSTKKHDINTALIVIPSLPDQPLWLHICAGSDVILCSQHKLIVENPLWFVIQTCAGVKLNNLKKKHNIVEK